MVAGGLLSVAVVEDLIVEAHNSAKELKGTLAFLASGFVLLTLVSAGLGEEAEMAGREDARWIECKTHEQRRVLLQVLALNVLLSVPFAAAGLAADSSALIADALDNASDSAVYIVSYFALRRSPR